MTMRASLQLLVLLLVALNLQCLYAKYYLVETDGKASSVHRKNIGNQKVKTETGNAKHKGKKTGGVRDRNKALKPPRKYQSMILKETIRESHLSPISYPKTTTSTLNMFLCAADIF